MPVTLITGASAGIGAALARELARRGHAVGLVARREPLLAELGEEIRKAGGKAAWAAADVTDRAQVEAAVRAIEAELGPVELLVANAGGAAPVAAHKVPVESWVSVLRLNVEGVMYSVGAVLPGMLARGKGHLAAVSSVAGYRGLPASGFYSGSKAAVTVFFESLRVDLRSRGIAVSTIHPGFIATPLTSKNKFPMPFLMSAERAAVIIADGLERRRPDITFPFRMKLLMGFTALLPIWIYDRIIGRMAPGAGKRAGST